MQEYVNFFLRRAYDGCKSQVDDFSADAVISQILMLDAQDSTKVLFFKLNT